MNPHGQAPEHPLIQKTEKWNLLHAVVFPHYKACRDPLWTKFICYSNEEAFISLLKSHLFTVKKANKSIPANPAHANLFTGNQTPTPIRPFLGSVFKGMDQTFSKLSQKKHHLLDSIKRNASIIQILHWLTLLSSTWYPTFWPFWLRFWLLPHLCFPKTKLRESVDPKGGNVKSPSLVRIC